LEAAVAITRAEVLKIAALAHLQFSEPELEDFTAQFQHILNYIEKLKEVEVDGVAPTSHVAMVGLAEMPVFREDEVHPSLPAEEALMNAPDRGDDHFRVPKVL
jgi:aspartyl-tRNA(Asn)/glutamyl-tRNA(Gln) amidotransferase subunit C